MRRLLLVILFNTLIECVSLYESPFERCKQAPPQTPPPLYRARYLWYSYLWNKATALWQNVNP